MSLILTFLAIFGLFALGGVVLAQFWAKVTVMLAHDEESIYGESLKSVCLER